MGRTYRGLSKKDRQNLKRNRLNRHKREIHEDEDANLNWKKNRDRKTNMGRNLFDDECDGGDEVRRR